MSALQDYLAVSHDFQLGSLDTEQQHPHTIRLSHLVQEDLAAAVQCLKEVDLLALERFCEKSVLLPELAAAIQATLEAGKRIFLCGCGATGRLSLSLEVFAREGLLPPQYRERVVGFMAGGDLALIKAIEAFEDHPEYGARQLAELGFCDGDLLISSTEGGETPFVIGATEFAAQHSRNAPWFLYCNPDAELCRVAERSRLVIANRHIRKMNLAVGPMAISGSTRMQASTVLMAAIGMAMEHQENPSEAAAEPQRLLQAVRESSWDFLPDFIRAEAAVYGQKEYVLYEPGRYGITVLTDTTERAPTFTLLPFENQNDPQASASLSHLLLAQEEAAPQAWQALLHRAPRTLEWEHARHTAGAAVLSGYDFSAQLLAQRTQRTGGAAQHQFRITDRPEGFAWSFREHSAVVHTALRGWQKHLLLKLLLNTHSTLIMGLLGRYEDNLMTYVKPSNNKLIDRAIRYIRLLAERRTGQVPGYEEVATVLFSEIPRLQPGEPIVLKTLAALELTR